MNNKRQNRKGNKPKRGRKTRVARSLPFGIPFSTRVALKYVEHISPTVAAGSNIAYTYTNSAFDPYFTLGGHQPLFYDQWSSMYSRYRVYGYKFRVEAASYVEAAGFPTLSLYAYTTTIGTPDTSNATTGERRDAKYSLLTMAQRSKVLTGRVSLAKWFGITEAGVKIDDTFSASIAGSPARGIYTHFQLYNVSATAGITNLHIALEYDVEFYQPNMVAGS